MTKTERRKKKRERMLNKRLVKKYYWLKPRNVWTGKVLDDYNYEFIDWGCSPGWDIAFGRMYMKELGDEINRIKQKNFMILEQKEKFGQYRLYTNGTSEKALNIINKYEFISENVCYFCGYPGVPMINDGWILPMCFDCYCKHWSRENKSKEEMKELYNKFICEEPNEHGKYSLPTKYTIRRFSKEGTTDVEYDISETSKKIVDRWNKNHKYRKAELNG